jgi:hypothetical protein
MTQLWLVPVDEPSYQNTMAEPITLSDCKEKPEQFPEEARVWGVRTDLEQGSWERNRRNLKRMQHGDSLLIYRNSLSKYTATGHVGEFWLDTDYVRDEYWFGGPARDVYSVEITRISTSPAKRSTQHSTIRSRSGPRDSGESATTDPSTDSSVG